MKICQVCAVDFTLYHFLLPLMRGLRDAGHEVVGACAHGSLVAQIEAEGFRVIDVRIRRSANPLALWRSYRALRHMLGAEKFDMVHVHTPVAALAGRLAAWRTGVPRIVYTAHGFYFHEHMPAAKLGLHVGLEWLAGRTTDLLFTQAEEDATTARRLRLARGPIHAIGNGSDPQRFRPALPGEIARGDIRAALGTPADRPVILMVGRLVAEKGYTELIEAMRAVDAELWIVGERLASDHADGIAATLATAQSDPLLKARIKLLGYRA
ncbi:MAG: glycosyltransferase, partial [Rhodospirillales bacterium]